MSKYSDWTCQDEIKFNLEHYGVPFYYQYVNRGLIKDLQRKIDKMDPLFLEMSAGYRAQKKWYENRIKELEPYT